VRKSPFIALLIGGALALSGCGDDVTDHGDPQGAASSDRGSATPAPAEDGPPEDLQPGTHSWAPVDDGHTFSNGLDAYVTRSTVSVGAKGDEGAPPPPGHDRTVTVEVRLFNNTGETIDLADLYLFGELLYGKDGYRALNWPRDEGDAIYDLPTRLTSGSFAEYVEEYTLPAAGLGQLEYVLGPQAEEGDPAGLTQTESHTFLDVQTLHGQG
jgi:hypothetical protein